MNNLEDIKKLVIQSLKDLLLKDRDIFRTQPKKIEIKNIATGLENRKLHETAINHRLAVYLENNLNQFIKPIDYYQVDIEYNRYFGHVKMLDDVQIRPDILIHKRMGGSLLKDNLLIIETKKDTIDINDEERIKKIITKDIFLFQYGLTIVYCAENDTKIFCRLFYKKDELVQGPIEFALDK